MEGLFETTIELIVGYFALLLGTRIMGRSSIAESTPLDFVAVIVLSEFVGNAIYDPKVNVFLVIYSIAVWTFLIYLIDFITMKLNKSRRIFESDPSIVIKDGVIDKKALKKSRIDISRLQTLLRDKNVFSFREIAYAILEPNGRVSIIKKPMYHPVKRTDLDLPVQSISIPTLIVSDGKLIDRNLKQIGKDKQWLQDELTARNIGDYKSVLIAEWSMENGLFVQQI